MKKFIVSIITVICALMAISATASAVEIKLFAPSDMESQLAPTRDFYVVGKIVRDNTTAASMPLNIKIELLDAKGNVVRSLISNVAPDGATSAQYFLTDYDRGNPEGDDKGANIIRFAAPDIVYDGENRDSVRNAHNKILVKDNYFSAVIYGGATKDFELIYTDGNETALKDITKGEYALIITALDSNDEVVCTYRRVLNFGYDKSRMVASSNSLVEEYAKNNNITLNNSVVGKWEPWLYLNSAKGFSYTIQPRYAENITCEYNDAEKINVLLYNLDVNDNTLNLKIGSTFASKAKKEYLYYDIGDVDVEFIFNGAKLYRNGNITVHPNFNFVEILRSEMTNEEDTYVDFNADDGFVLTKGKKTQFYGIYSPFIKSSIFGVSSYKVTDDVSYIKYAICDTEGNVLNEEYFNAGITKENKNYRYEFKFSITPDDKMLHNNAAFISLSLCDSEKNEIFTGDLIPIKINNSGKFISNYDETYWGRAFCDVVNSLGRTPEGDALDPDEFITRGNFASMINRLFGYSVSQKATFSDLDEDDIFYSDCATAQAVGYLTGDEKGRVTANELISREQAMIILARISKAEKGSNSVTFKDDDKISFWAKEYVDIMSSNGIVTGFEGYLNPTNSITVAEASALIIKTFKWMYSPKVEFVPSVDNTADKDLSDAIVSDTEFIGEITLESLSQFYRANSTSLSSLVNYIRRNCPNGLYVSKAGNGLEIRDYRFGGFVKLSDDAIKLISAFSEKFAEFSIRYNPLGEDAVHFVLGRDENGKLKGLTHTSLEDVKNKEITAIDDNWYYYIQK